MSPIWKDEVRRNDSGEKGAYERSLKVEVEYRKRKKKKLLIPV